MVQWGHDIDPLVVGVVCFSQKMVHILYEFVHIEQVLLGYPRAEMFLEKIKLIN